MKIQDQISKKIKSLQATIKAGHWPKGYLDNCRSQVNRYQTQLEILGYPDLDGLNPVEINELITKYLNRFDDYEQLASDQGKSTAIITLAYHRLDQERFKIKAGLPPNIELIKASIERAQQRAIELDLENLREIFEA
jgi:hypothetical protein